MRPAGSPPVSASPERGEIRRRRGAGVDRDPLHAVEAGAGRGGRGARTGERPQRQRLRGQHAMAGGVVRGHPVPFGSGRGDVHAQGGCTDGVQLHVVPGERQPQVAGAGLGGGERDQVQCRVEHRRMDPVPGDRRGGVLSPEAHLSVQVVTAAPRRAQAPEDRPVPVSGLVERVVQAAHVDRRRIGRGATAGSERARCVPPP